MKSFTYITTNTAVAKVKTFKIINEEQCCICDPTSEKPCSTNKCLNRNCSIECNPALCKAGQRCQNQRFMTLNYPKQQIILCDYGWGLSTAKNTFIKKGEFVNEYVGEIIDLKECMRRLNKGRQDKTGNFYFLQMNNSW